jgi:uncharacterized protein with LGFP repeats
VSTSAAPSRRALASALSAAAFVVLVVLGTPHAVADLYRSPAGTYEVKGAILAEYRAVGGPSGPLGFPLTNELTTPVRTEGRFSVFQYGSIYWTPRTGAHEVRGAIRNTWGALGWENSALGFPVTRELGTPDGRGRFNYFEGGSVYWTPATGAREVRGAILAQWASQGWERSFLGYPLTDELGTPNRYGRFNLFQAGSIYWSPATGAHSIGGAIRERWGSLGWENSFLGFPTTNEYSTSRGGRGQDFECGSIYWSPTGETVVVGCVPAEPPPPQPTPDPDRNCDSFSSQAEAQAWFSALYPQYGDVHRLDANDDLQACEAFPY